MLVVIALFFFYLRLESRFINGKYELQLHLILEIHLLNVTFSVHDAAILDS